MAYDAQLMGQRLKRGLAQAHISQRELARRIGVSHETVSSWIRGHGFTLAHACAVADELGWSLDWLACRQNPEEQLLGASTSAENDAEQAENCDPATSPAADEESGDDSAEPPVADATDSVEVAEAAAVDAAA